MTIISLVVAMSVNRVIGLDNRLPWRIPEELQHFKQVTMGKPIIMGRKTFDSIGRRLLPGRKSIILTRDLDLIGEGYTVVHSVLDALNAAGDVPEVMVVGGAGVYKEFMPIANRIYLSVIKQKYAGDAYFPEFDHDVWHLVSEQDHPEFTVYIYEQ